MIFTTKGRHKSHLTLRHGLVYVCVLLFLVFRDGLIVSFCLFIFYFIFIFICIFIYFYLPV